MSELDQCQAGSKTFLPAAAAGVSPPIQQIIAEDTATRIAHGWMEAAPSEFTRYGSPIVVALQKGKHSVCTD